MRDFWIEPGTRAPTLLVGYGQVPEPAINTAVSELAEAVRAAAAGEHGSVDHKSGSGSPSLSMRK